MEGKGPRQRAGRGAAAAGTHCHALTRLPPPPPPVCPPFPPATRVSGGLLAWQGAQPRGRRVHARGAAQGALSGPAGFHCFWLALPSCVVPRPARSCVWLLPARPPVSLCAVLVLRACRGVLPSVGLQGLRLLLQCIPARAMHASCTHARVHSSDACIMHARTRSCVRAFPPLAHPSSFCCRSCACARCPSRRATPSSAGWQSMRGSASTMCHVSKGVEMLGGDAAAQLARRLP